MESNITNIIKILSTKRHTQYSTEAVTDYLDWRSLALGIPLDIIPRRWDVALSLTLIILL